MIRAQHSKRIDKRNDVDLTKKQRKARENQRQKKKCIQIKERREKSLYIASTSVIKYRRETWIRRSKSLKEFFQNESEIDGTSPFQKKNLCVSSCFFPISNRELDEKNQERNQSQQIKDPLKLNPTFKRNPLMQPKRNSHTHTHTHTLKKIN